MRFRPCIDLRNGKVTQIVGSTLTDNEGDTSQITTNFVSDASTAHYAQLYQRDELEGGHVIMLGGGNEEAALEALRSYPGGLQVGGGITADNAMKYLDAGASHVIVTSFVFRDGMIDFDRLDSLSKQIGREKLILDLSCREREGEYFVVTDRWQKFTSFPVNKSTLSTLSSYCSQFLIHAVDVEGKQAGIDVKLVKILAAGSPIPLCYAGGVKNMDDLLLVEKEGGNGDEFLLGEEKEDEEWKNKREIWIERAKNGGFGVDVTIGSALDIFGGKGVKYDEVVAWDKIQREREREWKEKVEKLK